MVPDDCASRLLYRRCLRGWSQSDLARAAGLPQSLVSLLETGQREGARIQAGRLLALAQALGITVEYLLLGDAPRVDLRTATASAPPGDRPPVGRTA